MSILKLGRRSLFFLFVAFMSANLIACGDQQDAQNQVDEEVSPPSDQITLSNTIPDGVYWGDLHVHSRLSMDSFSFGNRMMTADDAFKFAKGEPVEAHTGDIAQLKKPLDFLLVSDHQNFWGLLQVSWTKSMALKKPN